MGKKESGVSDADGILGTAVVAGVLLSLVGGAWYPLPLCMGFGMLASGKPFIGTTYITWMGFWAAMWADGEPLGACLFYAVGPFVLYGATCQILTILATKAERAPEKAQEAVKKVAASVREKGSDRDSKTDAPPPRPKASGPISF